MKTCLCIKLALCFWLLSFTVVCAQTANFTMDKTAGCDPTVINFTSTSTGSISSYAWDFGDFTSSALANPSKVYSGAGTYTVKLTVKGPSGSSSVKTATVTIYPAPKPSFTPTPKVVCPCGEITFTNTSAPRAPGTYTAVWAFGDGDLSTDKDTKHRYCTPGQYSVTVKVTNSFGCTASMTDTNVITVTDKPSSSIAISKTVLCHPPDTTTFTASSSKGIPPFTYDWDFGDFSPGASGASVKHVYSTIGTFNVRLITTDANGCKDTTMRKDAVRVFIMSTRFTLPSPLCAGNLATFTNTSSPAPDGTTWFFSDGGTSTGSDGVHNFWKGGTYTVTMVDDHGYGCVDTARKTYTVYPKPNPVFSHWPVYPCPAPVDIHFENKSRNADTFMWYFGDGTTSSLRDPVHTYTHDSIFTVWLVAKTKNGCLDTFRVRDTTKDFPGGYPFPTYTEANSPIIVRVYSKTAGFDIYQPDKCLPSSVTISISVGTKTVLPSVRDSIPGKLLCKRIDGYNPPYWQCLDQLSFSDPYPDDHYDPPFSLVPPFTYPYKINSYVWDWGDGSPTSTGARPTHVYTTEGRHIITCTYKTDSCTFVDTISVEAGNKPTANFTFAPDSVCKKTVVYLHNLSVNGIDYVWNFGDGAGSLDTGRFLQHVYSRTGYLNISLTVSRYGCSDTMSKRITIFPPDADFGFKYDCDNRKKINLENLSPRSNKWFWDFGDGTGSTLKNPSHVYADTGIYSVRLIAINDTFNCPDTISREVMLLNRKPTLKANNVCTGDTVVLEEFYPLSTRFYAMEGETFNVKLDTARKLHYILPTDTGWFDVKLIYTWNSLCLDTIMFKDLYVSSRPKMQFIASPLAACSPSMVDFNDLSRDVSGVPIIKRCWDFGDGSKKCDTTRKQSHLYSIPGTYYVKIYDTSALGCGSFAEIAIESRKPGADFTYDIDTYTCLNRVIKFRNRSTGADLKYFWDFGDGTTSTDSDPEHAYKALGAYNITLKVVDPTGCKDSITRLQYVKIVKPTANFIMSDSVAVCPPLLVKMTNKSVGAVRYYWDFDNTTRATSSDPSAAYIASGKYNIMLVAFDKYGCTDTLYKPARVLGYAGGLKYTPLEGCAPLTVRFESELLNVAEVVWDFADGVTEKLPSGRATTTHVYDRPGTYVPRLLFSDGKGCSSSGLGKDTIKVDGVDAAIDNTPACINTDIRFTDVSRNWFSPHAGSAWLFDDDTSLAGSPVVRKYASPGQHKVRLISTNGRGCIDTAELSFTVRALPTIKGIDTIICLNDNAALRAEGGVSYTWSADPSLSCTDCASPVSSTRKPADYLVTGTDQYGCKNTDTVHVGIKTKTHMPPPKDDEICQRSPIKLSVSGAFSYYWDPAEYLDDPQSATPIARPESSVRYRIIGVEGSCIPDTVYLNLTVHPLPQANAGEDQKILAGTQINLRGTYMHGTQLLWTPAERLSCATCADPVASPLRTTVFNFRVTTEYGCTDSDDVQIFVFCDQSQLFIPNTFTPNNDGQNDFFYPQGKGVAAIKSFRVFNRWGEKVFERLNMTANDASQGWDGSFRGQALTPDTFVYTVEAVCDTGEPVFWKGDVTLIK